MKMAIKKSVAEEVTLPYSQQSTDEDAMVPADSVADTDEDAMTLQSINFNPEDESFSFSFGAEDDVMFVFHIAYNHLDIAIDMFE